MRKSSRGLSVLLAALLLAALLTGCGAGGEAEPKISVVATIFPEYDWVMQVLGDEAERFDVTLLLGSGVDLHSYQPTADDIIKISTCDLFIYVGGESDAWVSDALGEAVNQDMIVLDLMDVLGDAAKTEELVEGMEPEEDAGDEYDEHVWLSLKNAKVFCTAIAEALARLDPENGLAYAENAAGYNALLTALDARYEETAAEGSTDTLLFGDRFPFRYLTEDYGLRYYAAFAGCSAETEASFETVIFLAGKLDELGLPAVLTIEGSDGRLAQTIVENTADGTAKILTLDSMQSVTAADAAAGVSYLSIMDENLVALREALG